MKEVEGLPERLTDQCGSQLEPVVGATAALAGWRELELKDLVGEHVLTFAPKIDVRHPIDNDASGVLFGLDNMAFLIFEDPSDGYRSHAGPILAFKGGGYALGGGFDPEYIRERVICSHEIKGDYDRVNDVLCARSLATGEVVFRVGTENTDDYYPSFVVQWSPQGLSANRQPSGRVRNQ